MDEDGQRRRGGVEPRGFAPRARTRAPVTWRRVAGWLFGDRAEIDQEGLLAERTLSPRRPPAEAPRERDARDGWPADDER